MNETFPRPLGRYRLDALLGEGGMGKVYRAFDSALERNVAIKLLPPDVVSDASRLARFVQEARAASALNHPNVITVYDIGETPADGETPKAPFIAMELVDGRTLRQIIGTEGVDLRTALKTAVQVADGLAAAHAAGIIHRDLKPENIMVGRSGFTKILDFGLAKLRIPEENANPDSERTVPKGSEPGTVMGTVGYMSPEQAQGKPVDARTDVFSLGCVLYELAAGQRAFRGDSSVDTLHKIIYSDPTPLRDLRADIPGEFVRIVRKALAKNPDDRYQSVKEVAIDLRDLLRELDSTPPTMSGSTRIPVETQRQRTMPAVAWIAIAVAAITSIGAVFITLMKREKTAAPVAAAESQIEIKRITASGKVIAAALSPDAKFTAYVVSDQGRQTLAVREMASGQTLTLLPPRTGSYWGLTYAPDSASIYYGIKSQEEPAGSIYRISTLGGQPRKIVETIDSQPTFSPDGKRIAFLRANFPARDESALMIADSDGGNVRTLAKVRAPEFFVPIFFAGASWAPDGKSIATAVINRDRSMHPASALAEPGGNQAARIVAVDVGNGSMKTIADRDWNVVGQVVWLPDQSGLMAIAQEAKARNEQVWFVPYPTGEPRAITRDLFNYRSLSLSADGKSLITIASEATSDVWVVRDGKARPINASKAEGMYGLDVLSDGRIVSTSIETGKLDLFVMKEDGGERVQLTRDENANRSPATSPGGKWIAYVSATPKGSFICRIAPDGSGSQVLTKVAATITALALSPDGRSVVYQEYFIEEGSNRGLFGLSAISIDGGKTRKLGSEAIGLPAFSPDGSKLAVLLRAADNQRRYLATMPADGGPVTRVMEWPTSAYSQVGWDRDGKSLIVNTVETDRSNLWRVPLDGSKPERLTNFEDRTLFAFTRMHDGDGWVLSRGDLSRDAMLITGFRP